MFLNWNKVCFKKHTFKEKQDWKIYNTYKQTNNFLKTYF